MSYFDDKKILITGGGGFLGQHIKSAMGAYSCDIFAPTRKECDIRDPGQTKKMLFNVRPDVVIHAAIDYGDLKSQMDMPAQIFYDNLTMNNNLFDLSYKAGVKKFISFGSYWAYPSALKKILEESEYLDGKLEDGALVYGMVKRMLCVQGWAYKKEYNFNSIHLILPNIYGKNQKDRNVVASLINKFKQAKLNDENYVKVWGDGSSIRDFLYIDDAVKLILLAIERYNDVGPLNIGTGNATSIKSLVDIISKAYSFGGDIIWEKDKPNGIPFRVLKIEKMKGILNFVPQTSLEDGVGEILKYGVVKKIY